MRAIQPARLTQQGDNAMKNTVSTNKHHLFLPSTVSAHPPSQTIEEVLVRIGITNPYALTTPQAAVYLSLIKNIPTAKSTLEVFRCRSTGPRYKKVGGRVYYTVAWLDEYADGVPVRIFDPNRL